MILGHQDAHPAIAAALGLPVPIKGEWIAVRIAPVTETDGRPFFEMHGRRWARARDDDPVENLRMDYRYFK